MRVLWGLLFACRVASSPIDDQRILPWTDARRDLTIAYARQHTGPDQDGTIQPTMVVLHGTTDRTMAEQLARLESEALPVDRGDLAWAGKMNIAVHFVVDREGRVVQVLPEDRYGRHTVGFNHTSLAIEHLGDGPGHPLTDAQVEATAALIRDLAGRHRIAHLAGHHQLIESPESHPLFVEQIDDYRTFALDPGDAFVDAVAARVQDLGLSVP